jgi:sugar phosphate isomerase/epimerase
MLQDNPALHGGGDFRLGLVTYNLAKDWDVPSIIKNCELAGFEAVQLRTTPRHGVEPSLSATERLEVRQRVRDAGVRLRVWAQPVNFTLLMPHQ